MKKVLLTAMTILSVASASVFGMYGNDSSWIDFLVHGNQMRARMNQFGVTIGNGTIKGTFGFKGDTGGVILNAVSGNEKSEDNIAELKPTLSAGIGYTSSAFGIGVGYNYTWLTKDLGIHTPVLAINALNDNLRIVVPFQIASASSLEKTGTFRVNDKDYMGLSTEVQIRYYTGIDAFNAIRLYIKYGQTGYKTTLLNTTELGQSSFGFDARFYFLNTTVGNVGINPFVKVTYDTALTGTNYSVTAGSFGSQMVDKDTKYDRLAYKVQALAVLGITANSDTVSLYVEPSLGYKAVASPIAKDGKYGAIDHTLAWGAYGEIYITPVKDLEWYFEADVTGDSADSRVNFATSTGITWYLPSFQN